MNHDEAAEQWTPTLESEFILVDSHAAGYQVGCLLAADNDVRERVQRDRRIRILFASWPDGRTGAIVWAGDDDNPPSDAVLKAFRSARRPEQRR